MSPQPFTTIRTTRTRAEAGLLISMLQQSGLHPLEIGTSSHYSLAGAEIDYPIQVPTAEAKEAREILEAFDAKEMTVYPQNLTYEPGGRTSHTA